jgi:dolichyl-phosphooligosaccharide-protein glycotransferase
MKCRIFSISIQDIFLLVPLCREKILGVILSKLWNNYSVRMRPNDAGGIITKLYNLVISSNRITIALIILFCCGSYLIRILPLLSFHGDLLSQIEPGDTLYLLRQVELMQANFPAYSFFDPMTFFPFGETINWGPVFPLIITLASLAAGAATRQEIVSIAVLIPPLLAVLLIPLVYLIGVRLHNRLCGIIAALFLAIMPGNFFLLSSFGIIDHHVAEALFGCAFILTYIVALQVSSSYIRAQGNSRDIAKLLAACALCGIIYLLGYLNMSTIIIFALVTMVFTTVQAMVDFHADRDFRYLVIVNSVVFGIGLIGSLLFIQNKSGFSLIGYSFGHAVACLFIVIATLGLYALSKILRKKAFILYPGVIVTILAGTLAATSMLMPALYSSAIDGLMEGLAQKGYSITIIESLPLDPATLWSTYNLGLLLLIAGFIVLFRKVWIEKRSLDLFCLVWGLLVLIITLQHGRYEYLLAAPFAVISGFFVSFAIDYGRPSKGEIPQDKPREIPDHEGNLGRKVKKVKRIKNTGQGSRGHKNEWKELLVIAAVIFSVVFIAASLWGNLHQQPVKLQEGWINALNWLGSNSPDTGIDYYKNYQREGFTYPTEAYGVMSWWDYGHMITYFAHRIPNTNPFQSGLIGRTGGAAFFVSENESDAMKILKVRGSRYVITDYPMATTKFWAIAVWNDITSKTDPYFVTFTTPTENQTRDIQTVQLLKPAYFTTMVSRLQLFDGSLVEPSKVTYVEYLNASGANSNPSIRFMKEIDWKDSEAFKVSRAGDLVSGVNASLFSRDYTRTSISVPALKHFRLLYESPETVTGSGTMHRVKVFEKVDGARVTGSGTVTLDLLTNTGRKFQYIQESENGMFILPYATDVPNGATQSLGPYRLVPGDITFNVTNLAVTNGLTVN